MKQFALPALLLTVAMLASCDSGTTVVPGKTTESNTEVPVLSAPTTNVSTVSTAGTTLPVITTAPVTYPTLYKRPEITATHDDVVAIQTIEKIIVEPEEFGHFYCKLSFDELLERLDNSSYLIALVTPLELKNNSIRIAIDYVYEEHIPYEGDLKERIHEKLHDVTLPTRCSSVSQDNTEVKLTSYFNEIPISTTGGKYIMVLDLEIWDILGEDSDRTLYNFFAIPLTWELDMANVPGSTGDDWNRPPFIGRAEDYYAFGYGDIWERYTAE